MSLPISLLIYGTNVQPPFFLFFFFNDTATTEIYTLSLHDALPISVDSIPAVFGITEDPFIVYTSNVLAILGLRALYLDRKSTRLNSSHGYISYAVFCLKKKNMNNTTINLATTLVTSFCADLSCDLA